MHDKKENVIPIRNLRQALNHGLLLKKIHQIQESLKVIKFRQEPWLKPYIDMITELRNKCKKMIPINFFSS